MSQDPKSHLAHVPPEWVHFAEVVCWLQRRFGIDFSNSVTDLALDVRNGKLRYRIAGLSSSGMRATVFGMRTNIDGVIYTETYFEYGYREHTLIVNDWDAAAVDWQTGTVGGRHMHNNNKIERQRHRLELWWPHLEQWARHRISLLEGYPTAAPTGLNSQQLQSSGAHGSDVKIASIPASGRPPKYDWDAFWIEVAIYAAINDLDELHRGELQKHMVTWCSEEWGGLHKDTPDDATIRNKLSKLYKAARNRV